MTKRENFSVERYEGGISVIDAGFHRDHMAACYLVEAGDEVAFIEVGTNSSTPRLLQTLEERGRRKEDVNYVIVTHAHLDHAGGAGSLMQALPNATLLAHPYAARHLVNPAKLEAGARAVYGDEMFDRVYGELVPAPEHRTRIMDEGATLQLGNRQLLFIDTPGHARHHFCVHDSLTNGWFTGDTFGLSYREFDTGNGAFILPTTTPIQFDPEPLKSSVRRMMESGPDCMYLTHYGRVQDVERLAENMIEGVDRFVEFAEKYKDDEDRREKIETAMHDWLIAGLKAHGVVLSESRSAALLLPDIQLNTAGIEFWLDHRDR